MRGLLHRQAITGCYPSRFRLRVGSLQLISPRRSFFAGTNEAKSPEDVMKSAIEARALVRAGAAVAGVAACAGSVLIFGQADSASTVCIIAGFPIILYESYRNPHPRFVLPLTLFGGAVAGVSISPFLSEVASHNPHLVPVFLALAICPAVLGTFSGTYIAEACKSDSNEFARAGLILQAAVLISLILYCTKFVIDRTTPTPVTAPVTDAIRIASLAIPTAPLAVGMSVVATTWWAVFAGRPTLGIVPSPLFTTLFCLMLVSPAREVARTLVAQVKSRPKRRLN